MTSPAWSGGVIRVWYGIKSWWWWLSYAVRPYDMLADRRRWFWHAATPCRWF